MSDSDIESQITIDDPITPLHGSPAVHDSLNESIESNFPGPEKKKRGDRWSAWQDRYLATQILAEDPYQCPRGQTGKIWDSVGENLSGIDGFPKRSGAACKQRMETLIKRFKAESISELQSTGTESEISSFMDQMEEISELAELQSTNTGTKGEAKRKADKATADGVKAREDALKSMVFEGVEKEGHATRRKRRRYDKDGNTKVAEHEESLLLLSKLEDDEKKWRESIEKQEQEDREWKKGMIKYMEGNEKKQVETNTLLTAMLQEIKSQHTEKEHDLNSRTSHSFDPVHDI